MKGKQSISRVFKYVRMRYKLRQSDLAHKLKVTQASVSRIEKGLQLPRYDVINRLENLTNCKLKELLMLSR